MNPRRDVLFWGWIVAVLILFGFLCCKQADAAIRVNILTKVNQLVDDANNRKMSQANKILFLDDIGKEYGRRLLYVKRDTILTVANQELYSPNSDFAGVLQSAYKKAGATRSVLTVLGRDSVLKLPETNQLLYLFVETDGKIGFQGIPKSADTVILLYGAYASALSGDSTEWDIPDHYERPAYYEVAASILDRVGTAEAQAKAADYRNVAAALLSELQNPQSQSRNVGVSPR